MGKPKTIGQFRAYLPNSRADMRKKKLYQRNREYSDRHEAAIEKSWDKKGENEWAMKK